MKKFFKYVLLVASVCMVACSKENNAIPPVAEDFIELSEDTLIVGPDGGSVETVVKSSGEWLLSGYSEYIETNVTKGKSGDKLIFTVSPNDITEEKEFTYKVFTGTEVKNVVVMLLPMLELELQSEASNVLKMEGGLVEVYVKTNVPKLNFEFSDGGEEWVELVEDKDIIEGKKRLTFSVKKNSKYKERSTTLTIAALDKNVSIDFEQSYNEVVIKDQEFYTYPLESTDIEVKVKSNVEFEVDDYRDNWWEVQWLEYVEHTTDGVIGDDGLMSYTVKMKITKDTEKSRVKKISFKRKGTDEIMLDLNIAQVNPNPTALIDIADPILIKYLENETIVILREDKDNKCEVLNENIEWEKSFELEYKEDLKYGRITSLDGLEAFTGLEELYLQNQDLRVVDISSFKKIYRLFINGNDNLEELIFGEVNLSPWFETNTNSKTLKISGSKFTSIDVVLDDESLKPLDKLEVLDLRGCTALTYCECKNRPNLKKILLTAEQKQKYDEYELTFSKEEYTQIVVE